MAITSFPTSKGAMKSELNAESKAVLRSDQAALVAPANTAIIRDVNASAARNFYAMQSDVEKHAPWLEHATTENVRIFIHAYKKYVTEDNGIRNMTALVRTEARTVICKYFFKISVENFLHLKNE